MSKEDTRVRILEADGDIVHRKGFNNTGIKEILEAASVPKGSFYFYFENKEAFGLALVDHHAERFAAIARDRLAKDVAPPVERLRNFYRFLFEMFEDADFSRGCPLGNLVQEMSDLSSRFRERLGRIFSGQTRMVEDLLNQARDLGDIPEDTDTRNMALMIVYAWQGALMGMKLTRSDEAFLSFEQIIFDTLLKKA